MTYIVPNTDLHVLANVPLDSSNQHSIAFRSHAQQELYFFEKKKYTFSALTYQRVDRGYIRVKKSADDLYDCNYLMFRNTAFGSKWFYAFITGIDYINNDTAQINYQIDDLQTWLLDYNYQSCMIKRTHTKTDNFGENLTPEPFTADDYIYSGYGVISGVDSTSLSVIIGIIDTGANVQGRVYEGIYGGLNMYVFNATDAGNIDTLLSNYNTNPDQVVCMYTLPKYITDLIPGVQYGQPIPSYTISQLIKTLSLTPLSTSADFGNYNGTPFRPHNKKLYTYPYNYLQIDNGSQETLSLRYELFANPTDHINCTVMGCISAPPSLLLSPSEYKGSSVLHNSVDVLTMDNFPMCSWNNDTFKQWGSLNWINVGKQVLNYGVDLVKGKVNDNYATANDIASIIMGKHVGSTLLGSGNLGRFNRKADSIQRVLNGLDIVDRVYQASKQADQIRGNIASANILIANGFKLYHQGRVHIRPEQAKIIDDFFDMYGYAIDKLGVPDRHSRPHWTFIQTAGCIVRGNIPSDAKAYIENIHDRGITWWENGGEIGGYIVLDNRPVAVIEREQEMLRKEGETSEQKALQ